MRSPQKAVFDKVFGICQRINNRVHEFLPDADEQYPFIHLERADNEEVQNNDLLGYVTQRINVWGTRFDGKEIDEIMVKIHDALLNVNDAYQYSISLIDFNSLYLYDESTGTKLFHLVIEARFIYNKKG